MSATLATSLLILIKVTVLLAAGLTMTALARRCRAAVRHLLLAATFVTVMAVPLASTVVPVVDIAMLPASAPVNALFDTPVSDTHSRATVDPMAQQPPAGAHGQSASISPSTIVTLVWFAGVSILLVPLMIGLHQMRSLRRSGVPWARGRAIVEAIAHETGLRRPLDVLLHEGTSGPLTYGVIRPVIVLPADAATWTADDLDRAVVHELEHVRRGDWLTQCLGRVVCAGYWFHPLAWVVWRRFVIEAERACDDAVLRRSDATAYADQLVDLAARLSVASRQPLLAMAGRRDLSTRVRAVLNPDQPRGQAGAPSISVAVAASIALVLVLAPLRIVASSQSAQASGSTTGRPRYDVASIKRCEEEPVPTGARGTAGGTNASISPGRFQVPCVTAEQLIYLAYASYGAPQSEHLANDDPGSASNATKVRGGPDWVHSLKDKYQIEATAAGATERTVLMGSMLQSLLEDRFKLKLHRETEQVDMLELKLGKDGLKMKPMKEGDCDPFPGDGARIDPNAAKPFCGALNMTNSGVVIRWWFGGFPLSGLAHQLTSYLKVHVIDSTANTDKFVFKFQFQRDDAYSASPAAQLETRDPDVPSLNAALDAIGLKLEKTRGPRGYLVIDHIERPSPNSPAADALPPARAMGPRR